MGTEALVSYIFITGFLSGTVFMYSGMMMFMSGLATGVVCSRAGWVDTLYERFGQITTKDWVEFNVHIAKTFSKT